MLLEKGRSVDYVGEYVSHSLQTADDRCIGHLQFWKGATFLQELGFPEKVYWLVSSHVAAKRYICTLASKRRMEV